MFDHLFDDSQIHWQTLEGFDHLHYSILDIDEAGKTIDVLFRFDAGQQIVLHRHIALNKTFVVQGEHRLYHADGRLKESRPTGSYTTTLPSDEPHREGGGGQDAVVLFSIRGSAGVLYEILDDDLNVTTRLNFHDFKELYEKQTRKV
ncbi:MAG: cupin domain-containing protein [Gammaproteobacteria bacterium]